MHHGKRKRSKSGETLEVDHFCDLSALKLYYSAMLKELIGQEDSCSHKVNNLSGRVGNKDITNKNRECSQLPNDWHKKTPVITDFTIGKDQCSLGGCHQRFEVKL